MQDGEKARHSHPPIPGAPRRATPRTAKRAKSRGGRYQASLDPLASIKCERIGTLPLIRSIGRGPERCENDAGGLFDHPANERGVALLLALLVLALLVALILEFDSEARREYRDAAAFRDNFKAMVLSRAAVQAARAVLQQDLMRDKQTGQFYDAPTDLWAFPIEKYAIGDGLMTAKIVDERAKLNLNDLASLDPNARKPKILRVKRLFGLLQINPDLVDAIVDWVDADDIPEPTGAESTYYQSLRPPYRASNAPLQTPREMRLIKGMTPEIMEKLLQYVTIFPQDGSESRVNINTADFIVLQALDPRISESMAGEIIQARPFKTIQDLDRVGSFAEIGKELRLLNVYDVKSDIFSANMSLTVSETTKTGAVVLQRDAATGNSAVRYFRFL